MHWARPKPRAGRSHQLTDTSGRNLNTGIIIVSFHTRRIENYSQKSNTKDNTLIQGSQSSPLPFSISCSFLLLWWGQPISIPLVVSQRKSLHSSSLSPELTLSYAAITWPTKRKQKESCIARLPWIKHNLTKTSINDKTPEMSQSVCGMSRKLEIVQAQDADPGGTVQVL